MPAREITRRGDSRELTESRVVHPTRAGFFAYVPIAALNGRSAAFVNEIQGRRMGAIAYGSTAVEALERGQLAYEEPDAHDVMVVTDQLGNVICGTLPAWRPSQDGP
jgi:hypothetical protein